MEDDHTEVETSTLDKDGISALEVAYAASVLEFTNSMKIINFWCFVPSLDHTVLELRWLGNDLVVVGILDRVYYLRLECRTRPSFQVSDLILFFYRPHIV